VDNLAGKLVTSLIKRSFVDKEVTSALKACFKKSLALSDNTLFEKLTKSSLVTSYKKFRTKSSFFEKNLKIICLDELRVTKVFEGIMTKFCGRILIKFQRPQIHTGCIYNGLIPGILYANKFNFKSHWTQ
jgi:hypothetical protein